MDYLHVKRWCEQYFGCFALTLLLLLSVSPAIGSDDGKLVAVCSTTQTADFTRQIVGDHWQVICVLGPAEDPHTYEVGADDAKLVAKADLCVQNGWNLEGHSWMENLAKEAGKPIVSCVTGVAPLELQEGEQVVKDPHAWFDPKNAIIYVNNITDAICKVDPENEKHYRLRSELYTRQIGILAGWVRKTVGSIPANRRVLVTHHDAFGYFCNAFNFKPVSPVGWTTGEFSEVTPEKRQGIVKQIRDSGVKAIFIESSTNSELIEGIARDAGVIVGSKLYSDAMGAAGTAGESYIGMMRENVLKIIQSLQ